MWFSRDPGWPLPLPRPRFRPLFLLFLLISLSHAPLLAQPVSGPMYGVDVSVALPIKSFECLNKMGYEYVVTRAWKNTGEFDPASLKTLASALAGGFDLLDIYFAPCPTCVTDPRHMSGPQQIQQMMKKLHGHKFGNVWILVEEIENGGIWSPSQSDNRALMDSIVKAAIEAVGQERVGIFAAQQFWEYVFGPDYTAHGELPLWTVGYDDKDNFDDWQPFGGWCSPVMKQYTGNQDVCGVKINENVGVPPFKTRARWEPSCWSECQNDVQTREGTCIQHGKEVSHSLCSHDLSFVSSRTCPYHTPSCEQSQPGATCKERKECPKQQRIDGTCDNAPSRVCCAPAPQTMSFSNSPIRKIRQAPAPADKPAPPTRALGCRVGIKPGKCITQQACDQKSGDGFLYKKGYCPNSSTDFVCCYHPTIETEHVDAIAQDDHDDSPQHEDTSNPPTQSATDGLAVAQVTTTTVESQTILANSYIICHPPRHGAGVCMLPGDCGEEDQVPIPGYCEDREMSCCTRKSNEDY